MHLLVPALALAASLLACRATALRPSEAAPTPWELESPVRALPVPPLGVEVDLARAGATPEKVRLGRWLFFDARLSADGTVSCASCHRPEHAFSEPTAVSTGVGGKRGGRKSPPIVNAASPLYPVYFWDGRARTLAEQAKGPIENPLEMATSHAAVVRTVAALPGYRKAFREAYGDDLLDIDRIADAIAAYEATRLSGNSAHDRFEAGDESALTDLAKRGRELFFGAGRCNACHLGPNLSDSRFHNIGVGFRAPAPAPGDAFSDLGRHAVTREAKDVAAFKTPTLRDVSRHAPYMHDGSMRTLEEVVEYYVRGGNESAWLAPEMREIQLCECSVPAIVAFLEALDGEGYADTAPTLFPQ